MLVNLFDSALRFPPRPYEALQLRLCQHTYWEVAEMSGLLEMGGWGWKRCPSRLKSLKRRIPAQSHKRRARTMVSPLATLKGSAALDCAQMLAATTNHKMARSTLNLLLARPITRHQSSVDGRWFNPSATARFALFREKHRLSFFDTPGHLTPCWSA